MFPLVEFPQLVEHYAPHFAGVFSEPAFIEFKRYISGLLVSENKTVEGINRLLVQESRNQSSLNRLLTRSPFSLKALNEARLGLLEGAAGMGWKPEGVLSLDDTLLTHYGEHFEQIAKLYDPVEERYVWAHNLVTLHYSDDTTDFPVFFELWKPADLEQIEAGLRAAGVTLKESKQVLKTEAPHKWRNYLLGLWRRHRDQPEVEALYDSKLVIAERLLRAWVARYPQDKRPVTFDTWYTQPAFCRFIDQSLGLPYVGTLEGSAQVVLPDGLHTLTGYAKQLKDEHEAAVKAGERPLFRTVTLRYKGGTETYYADCNTRRVKTFGKVRLVISHRQPDLSDSPVFFIANRLHWQASGILRMHRHRWPVEVYHEEGKAEGLDRYQLRDLQAIERHIALVALVYSLLRAAQQDPALRDQLQRELEFDLEGSLPFWRRASQAHSLWCLALFIALGLAQGQSLAQVMAPLLRAVCPT